VESNARMKEEQDRLHEKLKKAAAAHTN